MHRAYSWRTALLASCGFAVAMWAGLARAADLPVVTGEQWTQSTEAVKKAYLVGVANTIMVEVAYEGTNPPSDAQSIAPRFAKGMKGQTLDGVREALDRWYQANPDKLQRPVIETIWFELVLPGLKKNS